MGTGWEWDDTLFKGTASYYQQGRLPYAPGLADTLAQMVKPAADARLLDVGCGPGTVGLLLAPLFAEVVGVDPDPDMIAEAERSAAVMGLTEKTRWLRMRAEDLPAGLGAFTTVTFGNSFHWMDRTKVAATVWDTLVPGGVLVHVSDLKMEVRTVEGLPYPAVPYEAIDSLVKQYLGPVRRAGQGTLPNGTPGDEIEVLAHAGFTGPEQHVLPGGEGLVRTMDDAVASTFSMSFSAPHLFGARLDAFEADLRGLLREVSRSGWFSERPPSTEMRIWRKA